MAKKKKKVVKKRKPDQSDLTEALERFINPEDDEFDLDVTIELMRLRPDWFSDEERERVANWAKARIMQR
jgi:predicted membrane GTPase involved in stress response